SGVHAQRQEDVLAEERGERPARGTLHHQRQQRVPAVAVAVGRAGREQRTVVRLQQVEHVGVAHLPRGVVRHEVLVVHHAGGVGEDLVQRRGGGRRRQRRQPPPDRVVQSQPAILGQQQDRRRRELLGDRGKSVVGRGRRRRAGLHVGL